MNTLNGEGYEAISASDGQSAIRWAEIACPDVVVTSSTFPRDLHRTGVNWRLTVPLYVSPGELWGESGSNPIVEFWVLKESGTVMPVGVCS